MQDAPATWGKNLQIVYEVYPDIYLDVKIWYVRNPIICSYKVFKIVWLLVGDIIFPNGTLYSIRKFQEEHSLTQISLLRSAFMEKKLKLSRIGMF